MTYKQAQTTWQTQFLTDAIRRHKGNVSAAARELGIERKTLSDMLKRLGVVPAAFRSRLPAHQRWYKKLKANPVAYRAYLEKRYARRKQNEVR